MIGFEIFEKSNMDSRLTARFPHIKSYIGKNNESGDIVTITHGNQGFSASVRGIGKTYYIDNYAQGDTEHYMIYDIKEDPQNWGDPQKLACGLTDNSVFEDYSAGLSAQQVFKYRTAPLVEEKTMRVAIACTGEFGRSRGGTVDAIIQLYETAVGRINQIWGPDFATQLQLVDETRSVIFLSLIHI